MTGGDFSPESPEVYTAVTLDRLGNRYGLLPSEVMARATTLDIMVLDVSMSYEKFQADKAAGKTPDFKEEDLQAVLKTFKGEQIDGKH